MNKKKSAAEARRELESLATGGAGPRAMPDLKKAIVRIAIALAVVWVVAIIVPTWIPKAIAGVLTAVAIGAGVWFSRYVKKSQAIGALLQAAAAEGGRGGREEALAKLESGFGKGDVQAAMAKAQLLMQDNPRVALTTLEAIDLGRQLGPIGDQVRAMRATIHLTLGEPNEARVLADAMEIGKQQDAKTRAMFATVAGEAWGRTGNAKKAVETLELFNPDDPEFAELRIQMWRARAFACAGANDMKGVGRALRKLIEVNPQLMAMFVGQKRVHPLLEREARQLLMASGAVPRKMVRQRM